MKKFLILLVVLLSPWAAFGQATKVELIGETTSIQPGQPFWVGLKMTMEPKWHTYWKNPGQGLPTEIDWALPEGFSASELHMPTPEIIPFAGQNTFGYEDVVLHLVEITPPAKVAAASITLKGDASWLECKDSCIPGDGPVSLTLPVKAAPPEINAATTALFKKSRDHQPTKSAAHTFTLAGSTETTVTLKVLGPALQEPTYLHTEEDIIDPNGEQTMKTIEGGFELTLPLIEDEPAPEVLDGILLAADNPHQSIVVNTGGGGTAATAVDQAPESDTPPAMATADPNAAVASGEAYTLSNEEAIQEIASWGYTGDDEERSLLPMLLFAFMGGIILNIMPCVFPVIGIKIMGFVNQAGEDKKKIRLHGLVFGAGVVVSMWVLVAVLLAVRAAGESAGWGFQLQSPGFLSVMIAILFVLGLSMTGLFELGLSMTTVGGELQQKEGVSGSFFSGVLAVLVATPCTGPFMGPAIAFALSASVLATFLVFTALALGVAFPYVLLSYFPALVQKLPRPGPWMETFKQAMSFLLFATVIWLLSVFGSVTSVGGLTWMLFGLLALSIGGWMYGKYGNPATPRGKRNFAMAMVAIMLGLYVYTSRQGGHVYPSEAGEVADATTIRTVKKYGITWEVFTPQRLVDLRRQGRAVFIDFTAKW